MKVPVSLQIAVLAVAMTGFYMLVGQAVPQKEVEAPEVIEIATDVSSAEMAEIGKEIFEGKGLCSTCHKIGGGGAGERFPNLENIAQRSASRIPGYTALDYLAESLYDPEVYIVEGFTGGMPTINKPPVDLTDPEILTVIAYLQTLGGEATVTMETTLAYTGGTREGAGGGDAAVAIAEAVVAEDAPADSPLGTFGCAACHEGSAPTAPELGGVGGRLSRDQLVLSLSGHPAGGGVEALTLSDVQTLVDFLSAQRSPG